jgi:hypothetical protein
MQKSFFKKVGLIFCLGAFLILVDACHGSHCNCPEITKHFFDFQSTSLEVRRHSIDVEQNTIPSGHRASIDIILEDVEFLVQAEIPTCRRPWFINSAFACSCIGEGNSGLKFPVTDIRVFSDADYSEEISAGDLLTDIVKVQNPSTGEEDLLSNLEDKNSLFSVYSEGVRVFIDTPPTVDSTHTLTIEIVKENGVTLTAETMPIIWL